MRKDFIVPSGVDRSRRMQQSIQYRDTLSAPTFTLEESEQFSIIIDRICRCDAKTARKWGLNEGLLEDWTIQLSRNLVPQQDATGTYRDFSSLSEWIETIKNTVPFGVQRKKKRQ